MKNIINRDKKGRFSVGGAKYTKFALFLFAVLSVVLMVLRAIDWGASHQVIVQRPWEFSTRPMVVITEREPFVILSPLVDKLEDMEEFTPIEQKVIEKWGYRDGIMALAIFDCGESGLDQYAVSHTGDLGIAQINWNAHKDKVIERGRTSADLLNDVDFNLEIAHVIWSNAGESWHDWTGYNNGSYLNCLR